VQSKDIIGTWRLQEYRLTNADGSVSHPWGPGSDAFLIYTEDGHMSATLRIDDTRSGAMAFQAVCGAYVLADNTMTHRIALSSTPELAGTDQVRKVRLKDGIYVLSASPSIYGGPDTTADLLWRRIG